MVGQNHMAVTALMELIVIEQTCSTEQTMRRQCNNCCDRSFVVPEAISGGRTRFPPGYEGHKRLQKEVMILLCGSWTP